MFNSISPYTLRVSSEIREFPLTSNFFRISALDGVINAESGYANGYGVRPNYRTITQLINKYNENNFAEVVKVTFNNNAINLEEIL